MKLALLGLATGLVAAPPALCDPLPTGDSVQVLNFSMQPTVPRPANPDGRAVRIGMESGFAELAGGSPQASNPLSTVAVIPSNTMGEPSAFVRSAALAVPHWMKTGVVRGTSPSTFAYRQLGGICANMQYVRSGLMGVAAEQRRRLLYPLVVEAACGAGLPVALLDAMIIQESRYNVFAVSSAGAFGLGQIMPGTARELGVNRYDLRGNLWGAARYLARHLHEFYDPALALAAYNAGPGRVRPTRTVPRIAETRRYVRSVLFNWRVLDWRSKPEVSASPQN